VQRLLGAATLADVANESVETDAIGALEGGEAQLPRELASVAASRGDVEPPPEDAAITVEQAPQGGQITVAVPLRQDRVRK
jgi:hypothetical protein